MTKLARWTTATRSALGRVAWLCVLAVVLSAGSASAGPAAPALTALTEAAAAIHGGAGDLALPQAAVSARENPFRPRTETADSPDAISTVHDEPSRTGPAADEPALLASLRAAAPVAPRSRAPPFPR